MRIDNKIISLPPFLSTSWSNIRALYLKGNLLVVNLVDGDTIQIPNLPQDIIEKIFLYHAAYLEYEPIKQIDPNLTPRLPFAFNQIPQEMTGDIPVRFAIGSPEQMFAGMQHNPLQANMPNLPPEMIDKISAIAKIMLPNHDANLIPKGEPHCNCPFCQISSAIHNGVDQDEPQLVQIPEEEEIVPDDDLEFQQWEITSSGEKLFTVTNKLDNDEKYTVFLGNPIGCTCGNSGCEHVVAVLKS